MTRLAPTRCSHCRLAFVFAISLSLELVAAQTTQPATRKHPDFYARASRAPIVTVELKAADGKLLTDAQKAALVDADAAYAEAEQLRKQRKYSEALVKAEQAAKKRLDILGPDHHLTISSGVLMGIAHVAAGLPAEKQAAYIAAEQALEEWDTLNDDGRYEAARDKAQAALDFAKANLSPNHPMTALAYLRLGTSLIDLGNNDDALKIIEQAQTLTRGIYGPAHPNYAEVLDRLGWVNVYLAGEGVFSEARAKAAVEALEAATQIYRFTIGETKDTAEAIDNLGTALVYARRVRDALDNKLRALFIRESQLGPDAREVGVSLSNLAWLYSSGGMNEEVLPLRERALDIFKKQLRPDHPYVKFESTNVAWDMHIAGRNDESIAFFERLIEEDKRENAPITPDDAKRVARLGEVYADTQQFAKAQKAMDDALAMLLRLREGGYPEQATALLGNVGRAARRARMYEAAERYYKQVYDWSMAENSGDTDATRGGHAMFYGALLYEVRGAAAAKPVLEQAVKLLATEEPREKYRLVEPLLNLARAEADLGAAEEAVRLCDRALQITESNSGKGSLVTAFAQLWLGRVQSAAGNHAMADFAFEEATAGFDRNADRDPTGAILVRIEHAKNFAARSKPDDAVRLLKETIDLCRKLEEGIDSVHLDALHALALRTLYDVTAKSGATPDERSAWKADAVKTLKALEANKLLTADESTWLRANAA